MRAQSRHQMREWRTTTATCSGNENGIGSQFFNFCWERIFSGKNLLKLKKKTESRTKIRRFVCSSDDDFELKLHSLLVERLLNCRGTSTASCACRDARSRCDCDRSNKEKKPNTDENKITMCVRSRMRTSCRLLLPILNVKRQTQVRIFVYAYLMNTTRPAGRQRLREQRSTNNELSGENLARAFRQRTLTQRSNGVYALVDRRSASLSTSSTRPPLPH